MKFHLYGTSLSGEKVDEYAYTDKNGVALFKDILIGENYTVEEVNTAIRYVIPESQGAVIEWNEVTPRSSSTMSSRNGEPTCSRSTRTWQASMMTIADLFPWN